MSSQPSQTWRIEDAGPQHFPQIRALFQSVFKQEMSEAHWQWKYSGGRGLGTVVFDGEELVAFFGGTERRVLFNGDELVAMQCGDSMVAESTRGVLTKKGPFYLSVTAFLGKYVGDGLPYLLSYGFPNARAMRLAERLGLYDEVGTLLEIDWIPTKCSGYSSEDFSFTEPEQRSILERCWAKMAREFSDRAIGIRDFAYIKQRFHDNPTLDYHFSLVSLKDETEPLGLVITRETDEGLLLVDVVTESSNMYHLVNYARRQASEIGSSKLYGWLTEVDFPLIANTEPVIGKDLLRLPLGVYSPGLTANDVRDKWFFMCGDSDFL